MNFGLERIAHLLLGIFLLLVAWSTDTHAQSIFDVKFEESSEEMIGETEKNLAGKSLAEMSIGGAHPRYGGAKPAVGRAVILFFGDREKTSWHCSL